MRLKESVIISELDDGYVAIDSEISDKRFNGMVKLNSSAKIILDILKEEKSEEELLDLYVKETQSDVLEIKEDVLDIVKKLKGINYIVDWISGYYNWSLK